MASPGFLSTSPKVIESLQKLLGKRPLRSPTTVLINNMNQAVATTQFESAPNSVAKPPIQAHKEEVKNDQVCGKESITSKRVKLAQKVEVHTFRPL